MTRALAGCALILLAAAGCSTSGVDATYGRSHGRSVNGTSGFAEWLRQRGHTVRTAVRLGDELADNADVIVRFAPYPGPPEADEADWYENWLMSGPDRRLIYVPRDYDAEGDYWRLVRDRLPEDAAEPTRQTLDRTIARCDRWPSRLPDEPDEQGDADTWFRIDADTAPVVACRRLDGPWAEGIDADAAALPRHEFPKVTVESTLLSGDDKALVMTWHLGTNSQVLLIANGSFLLNADLVLPARRPLAGRVVDWVGEPPRRVVFVDGGSITAERSAPSLFPKAPEFAWIGGHLLAFGLIASLARAVRLGRPRPDPPSGVGRPVAHAEALGDLLARAGDAEAARALLDSYRRWRHPSAHPTPKRAPRP